MDWKTEHARKILALARYHVDPATNYADLAFVVRDDWQGKGLGKLLMHRMTEIAKARGLEGFTAQVLVTNYAMMRIFTSSGIPFTTVLGDGVYDLKGKLPRDRLSTSGAFAPVV